MRTRIVRLSGTLSPGGAQVLADAVLGRLAEAGAGVLAVVLDLGGTDRIGADAPGVLRELHRRLDRSGTQLRVVAAPHLAEALRGDGPDRHAGGLMVHVTLRSAVLAVYATLPGPGLVTAGIRADLTAPAEPVTGDAPAAPAVTGDAIAPPAGPGRGHEAGRRAARTLARLHPQRMGRAPARG